MHVASPQILPNAVLHCCSNFRIASRLCSSQSRMYCHLSLPGSHIQKLLMSVSSASLGVSDAISSKVPHPGQHRFFRKVKSHRHLGHWWRRGRNVMITSRVVVNTPAGTIPWSKLSRLNDQEMQTLMIDVVNRTYLLLRTLFDEEVGSYLIQTLSQQDLMPNWDDPQ